MVMNGCLEDLEGKNKIEEDVEVGSTGVNSLSMTCVGITRYHSCDDPLCDVSSCCTHKKGCLYLIKSNL